MKSTNTSESAELPTGTRIKHLHISWLGKIIQVQHRSGQVFYMVELLDGTQVLLSRGEFDVVS